MSYPITFPPNKEVINNLEFEEPQDYTGLYCWTTELYKKENVYKIGQAGGKEGRGGFIYNRILNETEESSNLGVVSVEFILYSNKPSKLEVKTKKWIERSK